MQVPLRPVFWRDRPARFVYLTLAEHSRYGFLAPIYPMTGSKQLPAEPPACPEEVAALLNTTRVTGLVVVGYIIPAIGLWLMIFKPF